MGTGVADKPSIPNDNSSSVLEELTGNEMNFLGSESMKDTKSFEENNEIPTNLSNDSNGNLEIEEKVAPSLDAFQVRINDALKNRDDTIVNLVQRVAKFANDGKNTAKGVEEAWRSADTNALREKAKRKCATKCKDLWNQLEKQKLQVICIKRENVHYMGKLSIQDFVNKRPRSGRASANSLSLNSSIIEEDETESEMNLNASSSFFEKEEVVEEEKCDKNQPTEQKSGEELEEMFPALKKSLSFEPKENGSCKEREMLKESKSTDDIGKFKNNISTIFEEKSEEARRPMTVESESGSIEGEEGLSFFSDSSVDPRNSPVNMKRPSTTERAHAFHLTKIDFALAITECDVVLLDIELMQSLILGAETAIKGSAPIRKPLLKRVSSAKRAKRIASRFGVVSRQASMKMKAIKRAVAQVDKHRQGPKGVATQ